MKIFPVGLGYVATAMKNAGIPFDLLDLDLHRYSDEEVEKRIAAEQYDVVCMGCIVTGYRIVKELSALVRRIHPKAKIIVGNTVASSIYQILLTKTEANIAVMGEGDITNVELLRCIEQGKDWKSVQGIAFREGDEVRLTPARPIIKSLDSLPFIDFSIFETEQYIENTPTRVSEKLPIPKKDLRALPINTARGCIAKCTFCYHIFHDAAYRFRTPKSIVDEIELLVEKYKINYVFFSDELTLFSKAHAINLAKEILSRKVKFFWIGDCRAGLFESEADLEILELLKQAGCTGLGYSLESADPEILKAMNKHITVEQFSKQTELIHKAGMFVFTSIVIGYPQETPATLKATFDCCIKNRVYPSTGYLLPQPGSPMYDYCVKKGLITDAEEYLMKMGDRQDLRINLTSMSDEELQQNVLEGLKRCNRELEIGLDEAKLIKTTTFRDPKDNVKK